MTEAFHGTDADGLWTQRQSFEFLELALVHHLQAAPYPLRVLDDAHAACDLLDRLPTQTVRSESQIERSEEHTSELQSLMRISYAVFCLKKKKQNNPKLPKQPLTCTSITDTTHM